MFALPSLAIAGSPVHASAVQICVAAVITVSTALVAAVVPRSSLLSVGGAVASCLGCWLLSQASYPVAAWIIGPTLGAGIGLVAPERGVRLTPLSAVAASLAIGVVIGIRFSAGRDAAMFSGAIVLLLAAALAVSSPRTRRRPNRREAGTAVGVLLFSLGTVSYIGATTPAASWFGSLTSHGSRDGNEVAITFDDGPDPPYTLEIRDILDAHGVKATFFTVGKALDARPDVSQALLDDGHLLGNHSYHHDAFRWLDPRYPELGKTQDAFKRNLGVCPAFYRPPHGSHTPFMAHVLANERMRMVTWDVSAGDWATDDGDLVAKRVLDKVRPGSIILLHDGIDGNIGADRSVLLAALPRILDGLAQRGLKAVTLDKLLGTPGYLRNC